MDEILLDGRTYLSVRRAAALSGYEPNYISQLARTNRIEARRVGKAWFVDAENVRAYRAANNGVHHPHSLSAVPPVVRKSPVSTQAVTPSRPQLIKGSSPATVRSSSLSYAADERPLIPSLGKIGTSSASMPAGPLPQPMAPLLSAVEPPPVLAREVPSTPHEAIPQRPRRTRPRISRERAAFAAALLLLVMSLPAVVPAARQELTHLPRFSIAPHGVMAWQTARDLIPSAFRHGFHASIASADAIKEALASRVGSVVGGLSLASAISSFSSLLGFDEGHVAYVVPDSASFIDEAQAPIAPTVVTPTIQTERIIERIVTQTGISPDFLEQKLQELNNKLQAEIYRFTSSASFFSGPAYSTPATTQSLAYVTNIDQLDGITLQNVTFSSGTTISGLTDAAIPDDLTASNYLPLAGGTLTGTLTNTGTGTSSFYGGLSASVFAATSTSATSTFANGIAITGGCLSVNGTCATIGGLASTDIDTSAELAAIVTDESGTGSLIFGTGATLASTTLTGNFVFANATGTNATTTNLAVSGVLALTGTAATSTIAGGLAIETSGFVYDFSTNQVGIGTAAPTVALDVLGQITASATSTGTYFAASSLGTVGAPAFTFSNDINTGLWSPTADTLSFSTAGSERLRIDSSGNVGVGTTSPWRKLSVTDTSAQVAAAYDTSNYAQLSTGATGDLTVDASGGDVNLLDENLFVCTGGACPSGSVSGTGNLVVETAIGIGDGAPAAKLEITEGSAGVQGAIINLPTGAEATAAGLRVFGYSPAIELLDKDSVQNWYIGIDDNDSNKFQIARGYGPGQGVAPAVTITTSDTVGIGTTTPAASSQLGVDGRLFVGNDQPASAGLATSTFQGDLKITGKLDVPTIDPVYTIDGVKYATYGHSTIGVKEEVALKISPRAFNQARGLYEYEITFGELEKGSDLWLFYQVTDFGEDWENLVVALTPAFQGDVFYEEDPATNTLRIFAEKEGNISVRLIADRFDASVWPNLRPDQLDPYQGHVIKSK